MCAAVQLCQPLVSRLGVEGVHVLCDQPVHLAPLLPPPQGSVRRVGLVGRELRPAREVPGPVALSGPGAADELSVLHGSSVGAGVQAHPLRAVVRDPGLCGQTCTCNDEEPLGPVHKVLQQLQGLDISGTAGRDERGCRD